MEEKVTLCKEGVSKKPGRFSLPMCNLLFSFRTANLNGCKFYHERAPQKRVQPGMVFASCLPVPYFVPSFTPGSQKITMEHAGNKKPANRFRLRVSWNLMEAPGLTNGAEGESRTRTTVGHYPLKTACLPIPPLRQTFFTAVVHSQLAFLVVQRSVL